MNPPSVSFSTKKNDLCCATALATALFEAVRAKWELRAIAARSCQCRSGGRRIPPQGNQFRKPTEGAIQKNTCTLHPKTKVARSLAHCGSDPSSRDCRHTAQRCRLIWSVLVSFLTDPDEDHLVAGPSGGLHATGPAAQLQG